MNRLFLYLLSLLLVTQSVYASEQTVNQQKPIVTIDDQAISLNLFLRTLQAGVRETFYHGKIPDAEFNQFRHKTLNRLIEEFLLQRHGLGKGMQPDNNDIENKLQRFSARYEQYPQWEANKQQVLDTLRKDLERASIVKQLEHTTKENVSPDPAQVQAYYKQYPEKFTTPKQYDIGVILLKVDPSSGASGWASGLKEAQGIHQQITADNKRFGELARIHSAHASSQQDGELGAVHAGTLADEIEKTLGKMKPGEISEPVRVLEGYVIAKLNRIITAKLNPFEKVSERAQKLCQQQMQEQAWEELKQSLKEKSKIHIDMEELNKITLTK